MRVILCFGESIIFGGLENGGWDENKKGNNK